MRVDCESDKKKILFVIDNLVYGGAQRQLVELVKGLSKTGKYRLYLVSLQNCMGFSEKIQSLGVDIQYFPRSYKFDLLGPLCRLIHYIRLNKIDLVHTVMNMGSLFGVSAAKLTGCPVVCSAVRDAKDKSRAEKYLKRFLAKISDIFVANSLAGFSNRFTVMQPHFKVVYNGVDFSRFTDDNYRSLVDLKDELGVGGFDYIVGMVGSLSNYKDQGSLIAAAPTILETLPNVGFLLVGDGPKRIELENMVKDLGLEHKVLFVGLRDDVDKIYYLMDVCILLTDARKHLEGIPNVVVEAMACKIPVVASCGGGTSEIVDHEKNGILVSPFDFQRIAEEIVDLLVNRERAHLMAAEAYTCVHTMFGLDRYVLDYEKIYNELF